MSSASRARTSLWISCAFLAQTGSACAQGAAPGPEPTVRLDDGSTVRRDGGSPAADAGAMCADDRAGATCAMALSLGPSVAVGAMVMGEMAVIPAAAGEDWYTVTFPPSAVAMTPGGGTPTIGFSMNGEDAFRFDVMTACGTAATCTMGTSTALTSYSFTDDDSMPGELQWSSRMQVWPASLFIRVRRTTPGASCARYVLAISR